MKENTKGCRLSGSKNLNIRLDKTVQLGKPKKYYLNIGLKLLLSALLLGTLYRQLIIKREFSVLQEAFQENLPNLKWNYLILVILFMPLNWILETKKWQALMAPFVKLPFVQALKAILAGVTISILTPNRIGEYAGRIMEIEAKYNWKGVIATLVGSLAQMIVLLLMGILGMAYFLSHVYKFEAYPLLSGMLISVGFVGLLLFIYFQVDLVVPMIRKWPLGKYKKTIYRQLLSLRAYPSSLLIKALSISWLRYTVYTLQYYWILSFFGIAPSLVLSISGIATIYLLQTSIPLPVFMGLLLRGEIAIEIWGQFGYNEISIMASSLLLFIINLTFPALLGLVIIVKTNVSKRLGLNGYLGR